MSALRKSATSPSLPADAGEPAIKRVRRTRKAPAACKLFVLDTNVLMHDPTSLEELDNNKKGTSEVARNARQASRMLDEIVCASEERHRRGHRARGPLARPGHRPPAPADRGDRHQAAAGLPTRSSRW
jgi:PhoH-like ATPase